jgi:hypothetical protein
MGGNGRTVLRGEANIIYVTRAGGFFSRSKTTALQQA